MKEIDKHTFLVWWKEPTRTGEGITPEEIFQAGIDAERKRLSKLPAVAWTGKNCGEISDHVKHIMMEGEHFGGEHAIAAQEARAHDIALIQRPVVD